MNSSVAAPCEFCCRRRRHEEASEYQILFQIRENSYSKKWDI
jgi:hypothetical protein